MAQGRKITRLGRCLETTRHIARRALGLATLLSTVASAEAQVASALIREGDALPAAGVGQTVSGISNTAVNHVGGFAATLSSDAGGATLSHIWGNSTGGAGALLRTEGTIGSFIQESFESFYGMSDTGALAYSASGRDGMATGLDSVWINDTPVAVEENPVTALPGFFWSFASRPSISANGIPHWVGGITSTQGGLTEERVLATTTAGTILIRGGDSLPNVPDPVTAGSGIDFDYRFSALASHYILPVDTTAAAAADIVMVIDGSGLVLDTVLVREGNSVPASIGGLAGEQWSNFDFMGHTEDNQWFFTGDTDAATGVDEIIVKNGTVILREGDTVDGETLSGSIEGAYMNENGDIAFAWDVDSGSLEALYLNDQLLLTEGDEVDWDGDGTVDTDFNLTDFTGISSLTIGDRNGSDEVNVYFTADVSDPSSTVLEGFFCLTTTLPPVPVELLRFTIE